VFLTPTLFNLIVEEQVEALTPVREVLLGGEAASPHAVSRMLAASKHTVVRNLYGPTETTTFATGYSMLPGDRVEGESVPIGRPLDNSRVYVLDGSLCPVPFEVPGELYIG